MSQETDGQRFSVGSLVQGTVVRVERYGFILDLGGSVKGLVHVSEITNGYVANVGDYVSMGDVVRAKVLDIDPMSGKMKLSVKDVKDPEHRYARLIANCKDWGRVWDSS